MSKIFGYTNKGGKDWFKSDAYSDKEIEAIKDPEGGSEISLPTAIPSPFARIDLVKTAFRNIAKTPYLKAYTNNGNVVASKDDEKLVSDCLDLAEMLFNYDIVKDKLKIIIWDREIELNKLKSNDKHRRLAEAFELYLDQDKEAYNFDLLTRLYLIEYNHKIIGCTSPATLFFATANDLSHAQIKLTGNDILFDDKYTPLFERDIEFQKYFYFLFKSNPLLSERMTVFTEYLEKNKKILDTYNNVLYSDINLLDATQFKKIYSELNTGNANSEIEVLGIGLRKRNSVDVIDFISAKSDFRINSTKHIGDKRPLVLQNDFSKDWLYAKDKWHKFKVPFVEQGSIERRKLPEINVQYPYLTVSDFLEPYLIRLVYPINKDKFFDGNVLTEVGDDSKGFLIPLKKQFFEYFTSDDLISSLPDKPKIQMVQGAAGSVKVILHVPVARKGEYISLERIYYQTSENQLSKPDEEKNKGVIVEHQFGVTLFPFIKTNNPNIEAYYRVQLIDRDVTGILKNTEYDLKFFTNTLQEEIDVTAKKTRSIKTPNDPTSTTSQYYVLHDEFDFFQVITSNSSGASGIIIPNWQPHKQGNEIFSFAVDFGTTNTHIEYKVGNESPKPFDITAEDVQIATLFHPTKTSEDFGGSGAMSIRELIDYEFVSLHLGKQSEYKFPHRTVLSESHSLNIETETFSLADFNIPFFYEKNYDKNISRDKIVPNLKWSKKEKGNEKRVTAFFEKIIMLMRNKVLLNRGNLSQTNLIWFFPSSMKPARKSTLENIWNELFQKYFKSTNKPLGISESLAPFYYFKGVGRLQGGAYKPVVSIDIGGGTTDIVVFKSNKPLLLTSFKFAANTIFGDGFSEFGGAKNNGLTMKVVQIYKNLFRANNRTGLISILKALEEKNKSEDINAFLFSLENNSSIRDTKLFSYNHLLSQDDDLKILFLYFYSAIIYHIAELMKSKNIDLPKHLVFSGTGSKILSIITPDMKILSNLSKLIFEGVYNQPFDTDGFSIETEKEMPKEVTCKGGLMSIPDDLEINISDIKATLTCLESDGVDKLTYDKLTDAAKGKIAIYVSDFNSFFLKLHSQYSFTDYFNVSEKSLEILKMELNKYVRDNLEEGLEFNKKLDDFSGDEKEIEETLFFYPLTGAIYHLSSQLSELTPVN